MHCLGSVSFTREKVDFQTICIWYSNRCIPNSKFLSPLPLYLSSSFSSFLSPQQSFSFYLISEPIKVKTLHLNSLKGFLCELCEECGGWEDILFMLENQRRFCVSSKLIRNSRLSPSLSLPFFLEVEMKGLNGITTLLLFYMIKSVDPVYLGQMVVFGNVK